MEKTRLQRSASQSQSSKSGGIEVNLERREDSLSGQEKAGISDRFRPRRALPQAATPVGSCRGRGMIGSEDCRPEKPGTGFSPSPQGQARTATKQATAKPETTSQRVLDGRSVRGGPRR